MKQTSFLISIIILTVFTANAQDKSDNTSNYNALFNNVKVSGAIGMHVGRLNANSDHMILKTGGSASVLLNQSLGLGFTGSGFASSRTIELDQRKNNMVGGYGGFLIEPILFPSKIVHVSFPISFGGGQADYFSDSITSIDMWDFSYAQSTYNVFTFVEPGVNVEINLTKFLRFGVSASYLYTNTLTRTSSIEKTELDGLSMAATLKLGWFK